MPVNKLKYMNIFFQFTITLLLGFAAHWFLPWWWVMAPVAFLAAAVFHVPNALFTTLIGFFCGAILWWSMAFYQSTLNHDLLAGRMGRLFGGLSPMELELTSALLGGLLGGLGALAANYGRKMIRKQAVQVS